MLSTHARLFSQLRMGLQRVFDGIARPGFVHRSMQGQVFCCTAALAICGALDAVDGDKLGWWLAARQVDCGGLMQRTCAHLRSKFVTEFVLY